MLAGSFIVVPGFNPPNSGGGIWGYGGVSADPATGNIYAASGADSKETYTPYGDRVIALDGTLNLLGSYGPPEPTKFPCNGAPCDLDFGATPLVFQPNSCSTMAVVGNKNGNLYLFNVANLAASASPLQVLTLNSPNDFLGSGGIGGNPAFWAAGNMVYVVDAGVGLPGTPGGVIGLSVTNSCTLQVAWATAMGGISNPNSTPTVANGVVFAGEGQSGQVHAFDALTGSLLWSSNSQYRAGATYAAPIVAQGRVYAGSWDTSTAGIVGAFSLNASTQVLSVSPSSLSFTATQGGSNPASTPISVTNSGIGTLNFSVISDGAWLSASPTGGTAPQNLQVSVNISGLSAATYTGHLTVTAAGAQGSPATVTVTLTVNPPTPPILSLSTTSVSFTGMQGGSNPPSAPVVLSNTGSGTLTYSTLSDSAWLTVAPPTGSAPQTLQVSANLTGLPASTYTGHITVTATGAQGSPGTITATLTVNPATAPTLSVSPTSVNFTGTKGGSNPASVPVNITNTGSGALSYSTLSDSAWLTVAPPTGSAPQTLQVSANLAGLNAGPYTGHITVTAAGAQGSPATITANLTVNPAGTLLLGEQTIESQLDSNVKGRAEAFQATAITTGSMSSLSLYVDSSSTAPKMYLGVYADNNGHPGTLLAQGTATPTKGTWNTVAVPATSITAGNKYWIAVLGTTSGKIYFRDHSSGTCKSEASKQTTLTSLPATWTSGTTYSDCPLSAYGQ